MFMYIYKTGISNSWGNDGKVDIFLTSDQYGHSANSFSSFVKS